jgi:PAS domain S-box-containing protein
VTKDTILVVDDNDSGRYLKTRVLRSAGYDVAEAATAKDALDNLANHAYQVAVLDVKLPDMHGFELCRLIKSKFPTIGVLQTSATFTTPEDRVAGLEYGADAYLVEPMEETELVATVRALLRVRHAEAAQWATELQFAQFAQASPDVLWIYDADLKLYEYISPSFKELFGVEPEDAMRDPEVWAACVHADHRVEFSKMVAAALAGENAAIEYRIVHSNGTERWVRDKAFLLPSDAGRGQRVAGLTRDITESKRAEQQRVLLMAELNHRVKNTLAIVQAIAAHTRHAALSPAEFEKAFNSRLQALSHAHDLLTQTDWKGTSLKRTIEAALSPFVSVGDSRRVSMNGPEVLLGPNTSVTMSLAFHELTTNAAKYGALSSDKGSVAIVWTAEPASDPKEICLQWRESGGPSVAQPSRKGFGSTLLEKVLAYDVEGQTQLSFPSTGVEFSFHLPLSDKVKIGLTK